MATVTAERPTEVKHHVEGLSVDQLATALTRGEALVIDVRESGERSWQAAIPGAVSAAWGTLEFWDVLTDAYYQARSISNGRVVLHCASGERSAMAAATLQQMGYANVVHLEGGIAAWLAAGATATERAVGAATVTRSNIAGEAPAGA